MELLNYMFTFNLLTNCQTVFQNSDTILHSHQQCVKVQVSPYPHQHLSFSLFFYYNLVGVKWYLTVIFICISLKANEVAHLFMCLLAIVYFLWRNVFSNLLPTFEFFILLLLISVLFLTMAYEFTIYKIKFFERKNIGENGRVFRGKKSSKISTKRIYRW